MARINKHNFEQSLNKIDNFSKSIPSLPNFEKFETDGGLFGWGDHYITGTEINEFVEKVQGVFREQNNVLIQNIKELRDVYHTFDYLDKEYLQGILDAIEAARIASESAKVASEQAKDAAGRALKNEADIRNEIETLSKIINKLKEIKDDLNRKLSNLEKYVTESKKFLTQKISHHTVLIDEIIQNNRDLTQQVDYLSQQLFSHQIKSNRSILFSYIIGTIGVLVSIVALVI